MTATNSRRTLLKASLLAATTGLDSAAHAQNRTTPRVQTGLEALRADGYRKLAGLNIGLITNPTGVLPDFTSTINALHHAPNVSLRALFGPEHGVRGDALAGAAVAGAHDAKTGLPAYSLYGATKVPTAAMLKGLDALVFDLQDIGSRSYTYLSTLGCVLEGASAHGIPVIVLDRPNPIGLTRVEGGPIHPGFSSFVGKYPVAYRHGMTLGELAKMIVGRGWLPGGRSADLTVIPCHNLTRTMGDWESFGDGLPFVPTSPHIPHALSSHFYAVTGITGELSSLSIGVGYTLPFEMAGLPGISADAFAAELARRRDVLPGFRFRPTIWTPFYGDLKGKNCGGVQIYLDNAADMPLTRFNFEMLDALRAVAPGHALFTDSESSRMFDLDCGTDRIRKAFAKGAHASDLWGIFEEGCSGFETDRRPYLIYS